jgi:4-hydroxy-tetrahydrodipicolinate synthase
MQWQGVVPAITTPLTEDLFVDHGFLAGHAGWLVDQGCAGIVALGSLGEGATLTASEKRAIIETCVTALGDRAPVVAGIAAASTAEAVALAEDAERLGCEGLMVLPPYVHKGPWHEIQAHFDAIFEATALPCMLYNNPIAYGTDVLPEQVEAFAQRHDNLRAVKESSGDTRRVTAIRALVGDRLAIFVGLDDLVLEGVAMGAVGWIAGLVNALPAESVKLFELARAGEDEQAFELYSWFLPLLRMDTVPEFVQLIKLVQEEVGMGSERVRPPRQVICGTAREQALAIIAQSLKTRPGAR